MNRKIHLGKINTLRIQRDTDFGFFLVPSDPKEDIIERSDTEEYEVLLPNAYITDDMKIKDEIRVFIYRDSEDRITATTKYPRFFIDEFAFVKVVDTTSFGAFADIGLLKDLLIPRSRQKTPFKVGDERIIRIVEDEKTNRLIGVEKITSFLNNHTKYLKRNDEVKIMVMAFTPLGYKVIVNNKHEGMIFKNECFTKLHVGNTKKAYIKNIREDGKLDISLQLIGSPNKEVMESLLLEKIIENDNFMPFNYKSEASDIKKAFSMSKKNFKKSLTKLKDKKLIDISDEGIKTIPLST